MLAVGLLVAGCSVQSVKDDGARPPSARITAAKVAATYPGPDDWHRLALYGDWDFVDTSAWRAIVTRPDCDRATALAVFWKASPEYYVQFTDPGAIPAVNRDDYDLINLIRERWHGGGYTRAELAFDPDTDVWPVDLTDLRRRYGTRVDQFLPPDMRVRVVGRRLDAPGFQPPGVQAPHVQRSD